MNITIVVATVFFAACMAAMHKVFWMLDQTVPNSKEPEIVAHARRWNYAVAAAVAGAWIVAVAIALGLHMTKLPDILVYTGAAAVTLPVFVWFVLGY